MKNQKDDLNKHLNLRLDDIKRAFGFDDLEEKYKIACGFHLCAALVVKDYDWSDMWRVMIEQEYLQKRNSLHDRELNSFEFIEDTPFD